VQTVLGTQNVLGTPQHQELYSHHA